MIDDVLNKRKVKESTKKTYKSNLKRIQKLMGVDDNSLKFLDKADKVIEKLKGIPITSKKNILTSIIVYMKCDDNDKEPCKKYGSLLMKLDTEYSNKQRTQKPNEKQKSNWASLKELNSVEKQVKQKIRRYKLYKKTELTPKERQMIMNLLLLLLYKYFHIRNDWATVEMISEQEYKKKSEEEKKKSNWYIKGKRFEFYNFKTSATTKLPIVYKIPPQLRLILNRWSKINPTTHFLINQKGQRLSRNLITKTLQGIYKKHLNKNISSSMLRHIYISDIFKNDSTFKKKSEIAEKFQHSVGTQQEIYRKVIKQER